MPTRSCAATGLPSDGETYYSGPMTGVTVRVPGSSANLGSGFDFLAMAVGRWLQVSARCVDDRAAPGVVLARRGTPRDLGGGRAAGPGPDLPGIRRCLPRRGT